MKICGSCRSSQSPICNFYLGPYLDHCKFVVIINAIFGRVFV